MGCVQLQRISHHDPRATRRHRPALLAAVFRAICQRVKGVWPLVEQPFPEAPRDRLCARGGVHLGEGIGEVLLNGERADD